MESLIAFRGFEVERWRVHAWFRLYKGHGHPRFEFAFRLGWMSRATIAKREAEDRALFEAYVEEFGTDA
jgi:hypothetical protein